MKRAASFRKGKALSSKTLADLKEGDQVAEIDREDKFVKMHTIKRRTEKLVWLSQVERIRLDGTSVNGRRRFRVPSQADNEKHRAKKDELRKWQKEQEREDQMRAEEEFQLAKQIGWELSDADHGGTAEYLAFAKRIGLERLRSFLDAVEKAK